MARMSGKGLVISAIVTVVVVLLFRGAGRWLVSAVVALHGHGGGH
jgi:hypothetical protein